MEFWRYLILYLLIFEIVSYYVKYWKIFPIINIFYPKFYNYGIPLPTRSFLTKAKKEDIIEFVKRKVRTKRIYNEKIYIRRNYFKLIPWISPVPIHTIIKFEELDDGTLITVNFKTLIFPWFGAGLTLFFGVIDDSVSISYVFLLTILMILILLIIAHLEKVAIYSKIKRISELNDDFYFFA